MNKLSGPMFEPVATSFWESSHGKMGAHYNIYSKRGNGMAALRDFFAQPGSVNELNLILFSTSGVHGTYSTIEDAEQELQSPAEGDEGSEFHPEVTFLILQPRTVTLRYGNCHPKTQDDIDFLKRIRAESLEAMKRIGWPEAPTTPKASPEGGPNPSVTSEFPTQPPKGKRKAA